MRKTTLFLPLFFLFLAFVKSPHFQSQTWNPDAGLVPSYTDAAAKNAKSYPEKEWRLNTGDYTNETSPIVVSSNQPDAWKILDGDWETAWQSGASLPDGLFKNGKNFLLEQPGKHRPAATNSIFPVDGDLNTHTRIEASPKYFEIGRKAGAVAKYGGLVLMKCQATKPIEIHAKSEDGQSKLVGKYLQEDNYSIKKIRLPDAVKWMGLSLKSEEAFLLFEVAGVETPLTEHVIIDFGTQQPVGVLKTRHWAGEASATATKAYLSTDAVNWKMVAELEPSAVHPVLTVLKEEVEARYLKIEHELVEKDWNKVFFWEVDAYDKNGPYGARPTAPKGKAKLKEMLGVNGYWSWGTDISSANLPKGEGPSRYRSLVSHGRNYHDLTWDIKSPGQAIDFSKMKSEGTPAKEWLRWDDEYRAWVKSGMNIQASLQFFRFDPAAWKAPEKEAFQYAHAFVRHFGLTHGNGLVCSIEAGNEPWKYPAGLYQKILLGMAKGAKQADPTMEVFPCALQAADPSAEQTDVFKNYIGARLTQEVSQYLDGINIHAYSYVTDKNGNRRAVHPEHPQSTFWEILNAIRWRDENMPGKKIYLSEWGWDSDGGGEDCTHPECVSEKAAADYAVRAFLIASRLGIDRATWFFYANENRPSSLYTRSGLTSSKSAGFAKKRTFKALQNIIDQMGDSYFDQVILENENAWIYQYADKYGKPTHLVAWRPIESENRKEVSVEIQFQKKILSSIILDGSESGTVVSAFGKIKRGYQVKISTMPTVFEIE